MPRVEFATVSKMTSGPTPAPGGRALGHLGSGARGIVTGRLNQLLTQTGLAERELAERAGLPRSTVQDALNGESTLPLGVMVRLAHGFGLRSVEELIAPLGTSQLRREEFGLGVLP